MTTIQRESYLTTEDSLVDPNSSRVNKMDEDQDGTPEAVSTASDLINTHERQRNGLSASSTQMRRGEVADDVESQNSSQMNVNFNQMTEGKSKG